MQNPKKPRSGGFTLVEIMIVVAIIAILATVAVPSWLRARMRAQNVRYINDLRIYSAALDTFAVEHKRFPPNYAPGQLTDGTVDFTPYLKTPEEWVKETSIGGTWDIETADTGIKCAVGAYEYTIDPVQLNLLENLGDNGDSATGVMRVVGPAYYFINEEGP